MLSFRCLSITLWWQIYYSTVVLARLWLEKGHPCWYIHVQCPSLPPWLLGFGTHDSSTVVAVKSYVLLNISSFQILSRRCNETKLALDHFHLSILMISLKFFPIFLSCSSQSHDETTKTFVLLSYDVSVLSHFSLRSNWKTKYISCSSAH